MEIAERKLSENDYDEAKKLIIKAQSLYPKLDGLKQGLTMINVYISASNREGEADWYGILGVDPLADDETVKKQYKQLALLLHPDKNKFNGAEGAFKLVLEAWCLLSDKVKRTSYDQRRKSKEAKTEVEKQQNPHKPASSGMQKPPNNSHEPTKAKARSNKHPSAYSSKQSTFWTICNRCKTQCEYLKDSNLNKVKICPNCGQTFIATEKTTGASVERPSKLSPSTFQQKQQWSAQYKTPNKSTKTASSSGRGYFPSVRVHLNCSESVKARFNSGSAANQKPKRRLEAHKMFAAAEKINLKKQRTYVS